MNSDDLFTKWWNSEGIRHYTDAGFEAYMKIAFEAGYKTAKDEEKKVISISDNGKGFTAEDLKAVARYQSKLTNLNDK